LQGKHRELPTNNQQRRTGILTRAHSLRQYPHYDLRYFGEALEPQDQNAGIKVLMQTYLATFRDLGVQTWLMHGSLLGWWWGKKVRDNGYP
jgi:hypothetical protein